MYPQTGVSPRGFTSGQRLVARSALSRNNRFKTRYGSFVLFCFVLACASQSALIAAGSRSRLPMPKQAARLSVPVLLGTGLARTPSEMATSDTGHIRRTSLQQCFLTVMNISSCSVSSPEMRKIQHSPAPSAFQKACAKTCCDVTKGTNNPSRLTTAPAARY